MSYTNYPNYYVVVIGRPDGQIYELWSHRSGGKVAGPLTKDQAYNLENDMNEADKTYKPMSFE